MCAGGRAMGAIVVVVTWVGMEPTAPVSYSIAPDRPSIDTVSRTA